MGNFSDCLAFGAGATSKDTIDYDPQYEGSTKGNGKRYKVFNPRLDIFGPLWRGRWAYTAIKEGTRHVGAAVAS